MWGMSRAIERKGVAKSELEGLLDYRDHLQRPGEDVSNVVKERINAFEVGWRGVEWQGETQARYRVHTRSYR
jgi:hypothetical protein